MTITVAEAEALRWYHGLHEGELRELRELAGWSQTDLAELVGVNPSQVSRWESLGRKPRREHALALMTYLAAGTR